MRRRKEVAHESIKTRVLGSSLDALVWPSGPLGRHSSSSPGGRVRVTCRRSYRASFWSQQPIVPAMLLHKGGEGALTMVISRAVRGIGNLVWREKSGHLSVVSLDAHAQPVRKDGLFAK